MYQHNRVVARDAEKVEMVIVLHMSQEEAQIINKDLSATLLKPLNPQTN
jgi:hypothetical protein